jgi:diguanylate cyclase (GGDEF)-like protein
LQTKLTDEAGRLAAVRRYELLDTGPEAQFEKITGLVKAVLGVPMAAVTLVDRDRVWFKSAQGLNLQEAARDSSFCTYTVRTNQPLLIPDMALDERFAANPFVVQPPFIRSYIGVPLHTPDGYNLGSLCAFDLQPRSFTENQIRLMASFADLVVDEAELRLIAKSDFLTGALARRAFIEAMKQAWSRFQDSTEPAALLFFDIDHFKQINDSFGHAAGDRALVAVADCVTAAIGSGGLLGRLGGEEFGILLKTTAEPAEATAARLNRAIAEQPVPALDGRPVTVSIGVAALSPNVTSVEAWLARADAAMYMAKQAGRNCWRSAD